MHTDEVIRLCQVRAAQHTDFAKAANDREQRRLHEAIAQAHIDIVSEVLRRTATCTPAA